MKTIFLALMVLASTAMARGHTDKVPELAAADNEVEIQQIIKLPARLAVAAWIALSPEQRQEMLHYSTPQERAAIREDFELILDVDGLKR
jgi:hypothetical protein